jgi:hypothetical protein
MLDGHYLNLPVMNETGEIVGMVDVLKLTYATLEQINTMGSGESEGPAWNKFWLSMDNDTESVMSGEGSHRPTTPGLRSVMESESARPGMERGDSVMPHDSASHRGDDDKSEILPSIEAPEEVPFPFKFKAPSGRVHRIQVVARNGVSELVTAVTSKLGPETEAVGGDAIVEDGQLGKAGYALSYMDNEGDTVSITTDQDLLDAILLARQTKRDKVDLFVHDPAQPPIMTTIEPRPQLSKPPTPPESVALPTEDADGEDEEPAPPVKTLRSKRSPVLSTQSKDGEQIIAGVPNDLLLPGAIVTLAVVIVGVFAIGRATSK